MDGSPAATFALPEVNRQKDFEQISSVQDGIYVLGKAHMCSTPSHRSFPNVVFETVAMFIWLTMSLSCPFKEDCLALLFSMPLSSRRSMVWVFGFVPAGSVSSFSTFQVYWEASYFWVLLCQPANLSARSFPFYSGVSRAVHRQEISTVDVDHWDISVWSEGHDIPA